MTYPTKSAIIISSEKAQTLVYRAFLAHSLGRVALHGQVVAPPLREARTGGGGAVAVAGEHGLHVAAAHDVVVEQLVNQTADVGEDVPAVHECLVVGGGVCDA